MAESSLPSASSKALRALGATTAPEARSEAARVLERAVGCGCCVTPRIHLARYVGSNLFLDDDPAALQLALPLADRARFSLRLVAACIVQYGRPRFDVYGRSESWPS